MTRMPTEKIITGRGSSWCEIDKNDIAPDKIISEEVCGVGLYVFGGRTGKKVYCEL